MMNIRTRDAINTIMLRLAETGDIRVRTDNKIADRALMHRLAEEDGVYVRVDMRSDGFRVRLRRSANV